GRDNTWTLAWRFHRIIRAANKYTVAEVGHGRVAVDVGADEGVADHIAVAAGGDEDPVGRVAPDDQKIFFGRISGNRVVGTADVKPIGIPKGGFTGSIRAEVVVGKDIAPVGLQRDAGARKPVDHEALHRAVAGGDREAVGAGPGVGPRQHD